MDFSQYPAFQQEFDARYGTLARDFPHAAMLLDLELRNAMFGDTAIAQRNLGRQAERLWLADQALKLVAKPSASGPQVYIEMPGFAPLAADLARRFGRAGFANYSDRRFYSVRANKVLHRMVKMGPAHARAMALGGRAGPDAIISDRALLSRLEAELALNFARLKRFVIAQDIRAFVTTGDAKPFSRFLCRIARDLGLPYVVLAHGYISHSTLVSIAPLHADRLIAWTPRQAELLRAALPERAEDIVSHGFPLRSAPPDRGSVEKRVLFAWEPLLRPGRAERHMPVLMDLVRRCREAGHTAAMRLHPKERRETRLTDDLRGMGFELDGDDMDVALSRAAVVVSSNSTVLSEAAAFGIPAAQIADLAVFAFEGAEMVAAAGFDPRRIASNATGRPPFPLLDAEAFFSDAMGLMKRAGTKGHQ